MSNAARMKSLRGRTAAERAASAAKVRMYHKTPAGKVAKKRANRKIFWKSKMAVLRHYGGDPPRCACCGESEIGFLTMDHVNNDGQAHRGGRENKKVTGCFFMYLRRNKFPSDPPLQVLCYNCNCGRSKNGGICPHKLPMTIDTNRDVRTPKDEKGLFDLPPERESTES